MNNIQIENLQKKLSQIIYMFSFKKFQNTSYSIEEQIADPKFDLNKRYAVIRDDNKIVIQFSEEKDACVFSDHLNISYKENGLKTESKVIHLQNIQKKEIEIL